MGRAARRLRAKLHSKFTSKPEQDSNPSPASPRSSTSVLDSIREPRDFPASPSLSQCESRRRLSFSASAYKEKVYNSGLLSKSFVASRQFRKTTPDHHVHSINAENLYAHPQQVDNWLLLNPDADQMTRSSLEKIAGVPTAVWLDDPDMVKHQAARISTNAKNSNALYQVVLCCAPIIHPHPFGRDQLDRSRRNSYFKYVRTVAKSLAKTPGIIILEPEAMYNISSMNQDLQEPLLEMLAKAMHLIRRYAPQARVYLDAGRLCKSLLATHAKLLKMAGVCSGRGFSLNVGQSNTTRDCLLYAQELRKILGDKIHFVIDTSKNGVGVKQGPEKNNFALRIGEEPTTKIISYDPLSLGLDALLWIKPPGLSDGNPRGSVDHAPAAGLFWLDYALSLVGVHDDRPQLSDLSEEN